MSLRLDWLCDCETLTEFIGSSCGELVRLLSLPLRFELLLLPHVDDWLAASTDDEAPCKLEHPAPLPVRSLQSAFLLAAPPTSPKNLHIRTGRMLTYDARSMSDTYLQWDCGGGGREIGVISVLEVSSLPPPYKYQFTIIRFSNR